MSDHTAATLNSVTFSIVMHTSRPAPLSGPLAAALVGAYSPCPSFRGACSGETRWDPEAGHVPRGFCGATGDLADVDLVLVCAEPGDPHPSERYDGQAAPAEIMRASSAYVYRCLRDGQDLFHRNVRLILDLCFPDVPFDEQLRRTWITDSVLCSATVESGRVRKVVWESCRRRYLEAQLALLPGAVVAALGAKAYDRMRGVPGVLKASAAAPPGCNFSGARESWEAIASAVCAG